MYSEDLIRELCTITTKDEVGQHFTTTSQHWEEMESLGLIQVYRPTHQQTGLPYDQQYWTLTVTERGEELVNENTELQPE